MEATLADLKSRIEQLEDRVGHQSTFQGRGAVRQTARQIKTAARFKDEVRRI
jgi:hypothetical protein